MNNKVTTEWTIEQVDAVIHDLAILRLVADQALMPKYPYFTDKVYPLGRCKEIRDAVFELLQNKQPNSTQHGLLFLAERIRQGESLIKVWGSLRDDYFQNAIVIGDWYIDVANDTVNPNKPRIEVLPLAESGFLTITRFEQFVKIARTYWGVTVYRNEVCPALAPFMPMIYINERGTCWLGEANDDMLRVAMNSQFTESEHILSLLPSPPKQIVDAWQQVISGVKGNALLEQKGDVMAFCEHYRLNKYYDGSVFRDRVVQAYLMMPQALSLNR